MPRKARATDSRRIEEERQAKFCGTASIRLNAIRFKTSASQGVSGKEARSVASLKRRFREELESCQASGRYRVKVLIRQDDLKAALINSNTSRVDLMANSFPYPKLELPSTLTLECLQGHDCLAAAEDVLEGSQKRWDADIFLDDLSNELKKKLVEDYEYQEEPSDGEFYRKIREYQGVQGNADAFFEKLWQGRLAVSKNRQDNFEKLVGHETYVKAFDELLKIPALFGGMQLSVVHSMISMRCEEQNISYLNHIYNWWHGVCGGDPNLMGHVDSFTVESLQGKAPGASRADHDSLLGLFKIGTLFPNVPEDQRDTLWSRVCLTSTKCLIPSLSTFFADRYFLEQVADCLRNITGITKKSVSTRLANMFTDIGQEDDRCIVQVSEGRFGSIPGSQSRRRNLGIQQLWLAAFREYENVPAPMQQEDVLAKARPRIDVAALHGLASLALRLGFESAKINEILADPSDWVIAKQALLSARKPEYFEYEHEDDLATQIAGIFSRARPVAFKTRPPTCTSQSPKLKRHGVPRAADHKHDKTHLFLPNMESNIDCDQSHVTSFFVRMSMYRAFFGQSPISSEEREELLTTAVTTQENSDGSAAELDNGQSQEAQINEEAVRLQRLREDATAEQKKLLELRGLICIEQERFSREQAALKELQERSKAEQTSMTLHSFEDIVAKEYDEFMAVEEPTFIQVQTPYEESTTIPQEESNRSELVPSALSNESLRLPKLKKT
ncbi:hypothetical protein LEL_10845 [Akanthomyces lecanii RCEF 1005]|uniref:Uncharacterized protein n=1 Tax=Akanthomyces lecanii RCEF 1005 TaxID=1081108 RepID=A0A167S4N9_CORDF|nr:hypothetical protein LEL_10845 [Akanthomyces lecanii RCEF 1005]